MYFNPNENKISVINSKLQKQNAKPANLIIDDTIYKVDCEQRTMMNRNWAKIKSITI